MKHLPIALILLMTVTLTADPINIKSGQSITITPILRDFNQAENHEVRISGLRFTAVKIVTTCTIDPNEVINCQWEFKYKFKRRDVGIRRVKYSFIEVLGINEDGSKIYGLESIDYGNEFKVTIGKRRPKALNTDVYTISDGGGSSSGN